MDLLPICRWLESAPAAVAIRESQWIYGGLIALHVLSLGIFVGTVAIVDLRLLGQGIRTSPASELVERFLPWTRGAFAAMVVSGLLLLWSEAVKCYNSTAFRIKMLLMLASGINILIFHVRTNRGAAWDTAGVLPVKVKLAGLVSLLCWAGVVIAGRAVGYNL